MSRIAAALLASLCLAVAGARADTESSLGDRDGEGSTAFTGLAQAPEANLFTGSLTTGISLEIPPGRGGMTPQLGLQYSSGGGAGPFGHGWDLPLGRIERSSAWGTPRCDGGHTDDFVLVLPSGAAELVRESGGSAYFRPKVEEAWLRAEQRVAENQWVVVDRSGRTYTFGDVESARVATTTPGVFMQQSGAQCDFTAVWALTRIEDANHNVVEIAWSRIFNTLYPATVRWGANTAASVPQLYVARFLPEWRPALDRLISHRLGVATRLVWRIYAIDIELEAPGPGTLVRRYALHYDDDGGGYQSLLAAVGVTGRPTQHFVYVGGTSGHQATATPLGRPPGAYDRLRVANDSLEVSQSVLDMNGDGILDLVRSDDPPASSWAVYLGAVASGGAFGFAATPIPWQAPGNWTHLRNVAVTDPSSCPLGWSCTQADTLDLTGDGIPDHVDASRPTTWVVHPGRGLPQWGFGAAINWPAPNRRHLRRSKSGDTYQDLVDMNADGLPDLVSSGSPGQNAPFNWSVYLNTGSGFAATPLPAWPAPVATISDHVPNGTGQALADFNGDGLPDVVRSGYAGAGAWTDPRCQQSSTAYASCLEVYFNTGRGFAAMEPPIPVPQGFGVQEIGENGNVIQDLFDVNGDGLPDWVYRRFNAITLAFDPEWRVLLNVGGTLEAVSYAPQTFLPPPFTEAIAARVWPGGAGYFRRTHEADTFIDMVDVNGDGMLDHVSSGAGGNWTVQLHQAGQRPNLLAVMENGLGGTNTIVYRPSTAYDNSGGDGVPDLPFVHWVVARMRQNDGLCTPPAGADLFSPFSNPCIDGGHELVASFEYEDGRYDPVEREFRGFRRVERATNEGSAAAPSLAVTFFAQDPLVKGRILQVDTYAGGAVIVRRDVNLWGTRTIGASRSQIWLSRTEQATFDLGDGVPLYRTVVSDPPDSYGNITHHYRAGLFDTDRVDTFTTYATPQSGSLVRDKPSQVRVTDAAGVLQQKWYYYDGEPDGLPNGKVAVGNLVRVRARLSPAVANGPETRMAYDAAGNVTRVTDANGHATVTAYDEYLLSPRVVTNPLDHATTTYVDYRWGQPVRIVDPNGAETLFNYDAAGRPICAARPGDDLNRCTTETSYHFAAAAGELSWVETLTRQDAPHPPLRTRHHFDALGRPRYADASRVVDGLPTTVRTHHVDYDAAGRVGRLYDPYLAAGPPNNGASGYDYRLNGGAHADPLGRLHVLTASDGSQRRTHYEATRIISWDEEGQRTESDLDSAGRIVERGSYDGPAVAVTVRQTYDGLGRMLALSQNGVTMRTFTYDSLGRKTRMEDADSGIWRYAYDGVGNLRWQDDPRLGQHLETCYDAADRPVRVCPLPGDAATLQACDNPCTSPDAVTYTYDSVFVAAGRGRLARVDDGSGTTEFVAYDGRGRRLEVRRTIEVDGAARTARFRYQYDANDRVAAMIFPDGEVLRTEYDDAGQPIALYNSGGTFYVTDARYDLLGRPTLVQHANGVSDARTYGGPAERHRLRALRTGGPGGTLLDLRYPQYSPRGLLQIVADDRHPTGALSNAAVFGYDGLGRLTAADYAYDPADRSFAYDGLGNLTRNGDRTLRFEDAARPHQLTSVAVGAASTPIAHDGNGNRLGKAGQAYTYDVYDRLTRVDAGSRTVRFLYDYSGRQTASVQEGNPDYVARFYDQSLEVAGGFATKWYALGLLRVASSVSSYTAWEIAALDRGPLYVAGSGLANPRLLLVLGREAQWAAVAILLLTAGTLLAVPGGRRRPVVGVTVRRGPAIGLALLCAIGTFPWPLAVAPPPALAGGQGSGTVLYHHHLDHLGSTQVITNVNGDVIQQIRYQPYGGVRGRWDGSGVATSASTTAFGREFTGFQNESVSGLQYAGARFYDPELGTFLTQDARGQFASPYSYGGGDPLNWTDPDGNFFDLLAVLVVGILASAAINTVIAAAQGLPLSAIGRAAVGGAIAGAAGVGIGIVAAAGAIGAGSLAGTVSVPMAEVQQQLVNVAIRSAFSTTIANAAGQTAAAAGAPGPLVTAVSIVVGYAASYGFDQAWADDLGGPITRDGGQNGSGMCSNTTDHTNITTMAAEDAGFSQADAAEITHGNLIRDRNLWDNQDHFDFLANQTARDLKGQATGMLGTSNYERGEFLQLVGGATHHIQDPFALGHTLPGTSALRGPVAAPLRFLIHNAIGGEISFRQASYDATLNYLREMRAVPGI